MPTEYLLELCSYSMYVKQQYMHVQSLSALCEYMKLIKLEGLQYL